MHDASFCMNLELTGWNQEMFLIRDPAKFPSMVHATKRSPQTNLASADMVCDSSPYELILFTDRV